MKPKSTPDPATLRERALGYLARREHSRFELTRKLEAAGFSAEDIRLVLDEFEAKDWLSDRRFAESYVANHRAKFGSIRLAYELRQRGVGYAIIEVILSRYRESEFERAHEVWHIKFGVAATNAAEKARQVRFMQSRGFTAEAIRKTMTRYKNLP